MDANRHWGSDHATEQRSETRRGSLSEPAVDDYIERAREQWGNVGLAVAVVSGTEVLYARGFGAREAGQPARVDAATLFQVGSTTKALTAAALGILIDRGKVRWDDLITDHAPAIQFRDPWLNRNMTLRDALAHRSGIVGRYSPALGLVDADEVLRQLRVIPSEAAFRASFRYSNLLYAVVGKVIECVSGTTWPQFITESLLRPLEMHRSGTSPYQYWCEKHVAPTFFGSAPDGPPTSSDARDSNVAMPHGWDDQDQAVVLPWQSYDSAAAAGAIVSNVLEMANWLILNVNEGCYAGRQLLSQPTMRELHATQNAYVNDAQFPFAATDETYAMGWRRSSYRGEPHLQHGGGMIGFPAYVAILPESRLGVIVVSNGSRGARDRIGFFKLSLHKAVALWVLDRLLGVPVHDWSKEFLAREQVKRNEIQQHEDELRRARLAGTAPSLPLHAYAGVYADAGGHSGRVHVLIEGGRLGLCFEGRGAFRAELEHWHRDVFRLRLNPGTSDVLGPTFAGFTIDPRAKVVSMSLLDMTLKPVAP